MSATLPERLYRDSSKPRAPRRKADTSSLRLWLDKRRRSLENSRAPFESLWKDIRLQFEPAIGKALLTAEERDMAAADREDRAILNSEPRLAVKRYAAGMQSGITNKAQAWCAIVPKNLPEEYKRDVEISRWCSAATEEILAALERNNFYRSSLAVYLHAGLIGTSLVLVVRGATPGEVLFQVVDEGDYWIAEDRFNRVDTILRRVEMTVRQAADEFYRAALPETWQTMLDDGRDEERVEVFNLICPNRPGGPLFADIPAERAFASFWWTEKARGETNGILDIRSFSYKPFGVMRQSLGVSAWGKGIGEESLADARELQELERHSLDIVAQESDPALLAPASMKGTAINRFPGGVTYYNGVMASGDAPVTRLFETRNSLEAVEAKIQTVSQRISSAWYNDLFSLMLSLNRDNRAQKTATEISELAGEKVTLLGPVLTQMDDFLNDIVDAVFAILYTDGIIPPPPERLVMAGGDISVEYTSSLHAEMKAALKMRSINILVEQSAMLAQFKPEALDKIKSDDIVDEIATVFPAASKFVATKRETEILRAQRAQMQEEQIRQAQLAEAAKTAGTQAKALSETKLGNGNALEALMGGIGQ